MIAQTHRSKVITVSAFNLTHLAKVKHDSLPAEAPETTPNWVVRFVINSKGIYPSEGYLVKYPDGSHECMAVDNFQSKFEVITEQVG